MFPIISWMYWSPQIRIYGGITIHALDDIILIPNNDNLMQLGTDVRKWFIISR
jgi:hypothetical protein